MSRAVDAVFNSLKQQIDADTEIAIGAMDAMERVTINATKKYEAVADAAKTLDADTAEFKKLNGEIQQYTQRLDAIDAQITTLESLARELDQWSQELEVKARRYSRASLAR